MGTPPAKRIIPARPPATSARKKSSNPRVAKSLQRARRFMIFLAAPPAHRTHSNIYHSLSRLAAPKQKCTPNVFARKISMREILCVCVYGGLAGGLAYTNIYHWGAHIRTLAADEYILFRFIRCCCPRTPCMLCTWARL
jgi:hypothetical protein